MRETYKLWRVWSKDRQTGKWDELAALQVARNTKELKKGMLGTPIKAEVVRKPFTDEEWTKKVEELHRKIKTASVKYIKVSEAAKHAIESGVGGYAEKGKTYVIVTRHENKKQIQETAEHEIAHTVVSPTKSKDYLQGPFESIWEEIEVRILTNKAFGHPTAKEFIDELQFYAELTYHPSQKRGILHWLTQVEEILYNNWIEHAPKGWQSEFIKYKGKLTQYLNKYEKKEQAKEREEEREIKRKAIKKGLILYKHRKHKKIKVIKPAKVSLGRVK